MKNFDYLIQNFFTHKDFLPPASQLPGTLFTPLHFIFSAICLGIVLFSAIYVSKRPKIIRPVFISLLAVLIVMEFVIIAWDSMAGKNIGLDLSSSLSLYPCSIFMYAMPFAIWGKGCVKKMACGYVCTLGFLGAAVNFIYPAIRLSTYSCISFPGFHTFIYHGSMLFTYLVMILSNYHRYTNVKNWKQLFFPCIPTLLISIPANIINYSSIDADYMFFRGHFPFLSVLFSGVSEVVITLLLYALYIFIPALFYLPSYLAQKKKVIASVYAASDV